MGNYVETVVTVTAVVELTEAELEEICYALRDHGNELWYTMEDILEDLLREKEGDR